ncbi:hypothetical protein C8J57DRAFT_1222553 [Mycena rebaudengoi]|nr:hypothetical protein C8J57DRAFT_1222553 [Mycena rebaudengoi]
MSAVALLLFSRQFCACLHPCPMGCWACRIETPSDHTGHYTGHHIAGVILPENAREIRQQKAARAACPWEPAKSQKRSAFSHAVGSVEPRRSPTISFHVLPVGDELVGIGNNLNHGTSNTSVLLYLPGRLIV